MWIDEKYIGMLSPHLQGFVKKGNGVYNFRCPKCGDSKKTRSKKRGYLLRKNDSYIFYCHNGCPSTSFKNLLKELAPALWSEYNVERFKDTKKEAYEPKKEEPFKLARQNNIFNIQRASFSTIASKFLEERGFSLKMMMNREMYFTSQFQHWVNGIINGKFKDPKPDPRIVIPLYDQYGELFGFQGRSTSNSAQRYITIKFDPEHYKLYGVNKCNFAKRYFVTEGPFDSMFLDNAIASCGGKIQTEVKKLNLAPKNSVIVYDNQPRNREVVNNLFDAIQSNYSVVIWPKNIAQKDINDMIVADARHNISRIEDSRLYIQNIMNENTYQGLEAYLRFIDWRKI